jgi:tetratricopeptide (TPR) repeat protein
MNTNIEISQISNHFFFHLKKQRENKKIFENKIVVYDFFSVNEANICDKIKEIPYYSNNYNILNDYDYIELAQVNDKKIIELNINNLSDIDKNNINKFNQYLLFKYNYDKCIPFNDFLYNLRNPKILILNLLESFSYLLVSLIKLNENNICFFNLSNENIIFKGDKPIIRDFRYSLQVSKLNESYICKIIEKMNNYTYKPLEIQPLTVSKRDIGIEDDEIMFWCCQSLFKYLPQHDDIFSKIAKGLINTKFVFIQHQSEYITEVFRQRLQHTFEEFGLNYQDYCIFLQGMNIRRFTGISAIADVFLDSIGWSGCNSTLESIAHNVPVVTLPGELMRGRHSLAILKMMGIQEMIASSKEEYVQLAIRLGRDAEYRQHISQLIAQNKHKLYGDLEPIRALEEFLLNAVGKPRISTINNVAEILRLAIQAHRENHLQQAEEAYRQVLSMQPNHADALSGLGMVAQQKGELTEAERWLSASAQIQPDSVKVWFTLGNLHQLQGQLPEAEAAYKKAIVLRPDAVSIYNNLGYTLQQQDKWEEAINCYQKALELQPNCVEADVNLGNALHSQDKLSPDKQADYAELNYKLGLARKNAGDLQTAEVYYRQAITLQPNFTDAHHHLGLVLEKQGKLEEAKVCYQRAL